MDRLKILRNQDASHPEVLIMEQQLQVIAGQKENSSQVGLRFFSDFIFEFKRKYKRDEFYFPIRGQDFVRDVLANLSMSIIQASIKYFVILLYLLKHPLQFIFFPNCAIWSNASNEDGWAFR